MNQTPPAHRSSTEIFDPKTAGDVVDAAIARFFDARRARVDEFVDRTFSLRGSVGIHRRAFGWDLLRAPANLALVPIQVGAMLSGSAARRFGAKKSGDWLSDRRILLRTDVDREIEWRLWTDLLELPFEAEGRLVRRDALAEAMFEDPRLHAAIAEPLAEIARHADDPGLRAKIETTVAAYTGTRHAAADIVGAMVNAGTGYIAAQQLTPSVWSLGPVLAAAIANHVALSGFPLGATVGGIWYSMFPATVGPALIGATTAGLAAIGAVVAAFAGIVADPAQRALGIHRRRLIKMLDTLERGFQGDNSARFAPKDHYVARLLDFVDMVRAAHKVIKSAS
jgi:hypothetical protein